MRARVRSLTTEVRYRSCRRDVSSLRRRRPADYLTALEAGLYLGVAQLLLALPSRLLVGAVRRAMGPAASAAAAPPVDRLAAISGALARRWPTNALCLQRSLALLWLLRRRGIGAELKIGVRRTDGQLQAHAWVEVGGVAVNDDASHHGGFVVLNGEAEPIPLLREAELVS